MKIAINTSHQRFGGCIQVALSFINECKNFPQHDYYVWVGPGVSKSLRENEFPQNFHFEYFNFGPITFQKTFTINKTMKAVEQRIKPDVIISTSGPTYFHSQAPQIIGYNIPLYIYPESPFLKQISLYRKLRRVIKKELHFYYFKRDSDHIVVQTEDVNQRVRKALRTDKVLTVTNTANSFYQTKPVFSPKLPKADPNVFRFVTISSYYGHKNLELIPEVIKELKKRNISNVEFVLTLKPEDFQRHIGSNKNIINIGPIKPEECPSLYSECNGMFLPTLAECFSASYPEAMAMEKPIVTTDMGFARSICKSAALFFKPMDAVSATDKIIELISDPLIGEKLIEEGKKRLVEFDSPESRAEKYLRLCENYG